MALALLLGAAIIASAQNYSIDWHTMDGGGGTSTGAVYSVTGTIGQPDAGAAAGGNFSIAGGFWNASVIQMPGAPLLRIFATSTNAVVVAWLAPSPGFSLRENLSLDTTNWTTVTNAEVLVGSEKHVIISPPSGNRFYRLSTE